ncbi:serine-rich adhesin for platelets isoform X2 [Chironomus tepperi]|uniref:serine-rich adhesin for platelets isoform X2 n=1 Tax=Chironomus tepperi TaxID=113505 RepID=UPI00391F85CE
MGKCISKDQQLKIREIDERSYIAITDEFEYYHYEEVYNEEEKFVEDEGQSESKKTSNKKMHGPETRGTSMSFGFKKKAYSATSKKQQQNIANNNNVNVNREKDEKSTIISNHNVINAEQNNLIITGDDNGNSTNTETIHDKEMGTARTTSPAKLQPAKRDQILVGRSNRFGFRQNVVRPTSGITPKFNEYDNVNNNNNNNISNTIDKQRRSKSATPTTQLRSNVNPQASSKSELNPMKTIIEQPEQKVIKQQNEQNANINSSRPTSTSSTTTTSQSSNANQPIVLSRYTLHSTSLPRPQYPVPVSVTPSYPSFSRISTYSPNSTRPTHSVQSKLIDTKGAKQQANLNKRGGMMTRDESLDSGIASHDSTSDNHQNQMETSLLRRSRRRFEMVPGPSRHKFEIRDLNDYNENSVIVPLSLPKLPTDRKEIVTEGLIRSTNSYSTDNEMDMSMSISECGSRPTSFISTASESESFEEEKLKIDNSLSEKSYKGAIMKQSLMTSSKNSSTGSIKSKSSWLGNNCGESMALNNSTSVSLNSSDEDHRNKNNNTQSICTRKKDIDCDEDELSSMTITAEHSSCLTTSSPSKDQKEIVNDAFLKQSQQQQQPRIGSISRKELFIQVDEVKFAETIAATQNTALLDDETSPSDSLVSSSESGDAPMKKIKESKTIDEIKEEDLEDITPELVDLPSPGTPTHASNSLSLSDDVCRDDFLIDDEIADQPALMISQKKQQRGSLSHHDDYTSGAMNLSCTTDGTTPTLKDISVNSHGSLRSLNKIHMHTLKTINSGQSSPAMNRKVILERSGSLDTLSPCDSIASDDLMADFDINSSLDSIDRHERSIDDFCIQSETECKINGDQRKEYGAIFKPQQSVQRRHSSRENITSQLPLRATRLLNRRLQNNNNINTSPLNGSESPRSLDSMHSRTSSARASLREHLKQRQHLNLQSQLEHSSTEDLLVDKSFRNSMLQDVASFKKQLVQLRRILQEDEDKLMMSDTLNPFEINGHIFSNLNRASDAEISASDKEKKDDEKNVVLTNEQIILLEDQRQELADLKRQVVFLQSQMDDKDRVIKQQQIKLEELEKEKIKSLDTNATAQDSKNNNIETVNCATQTERLRPMSMGQDFTSPLDSHPKSPNDETKSKQIPTITIKSSPPRSKTQISSVYTKLSSIKPTTTTPTSQTKNSSIPTTGTSAKPMKSTKIEHPKMTPVRIINTSNINRGNDVKTPFKRTIPQLVKSVVNGSSNKNNCTQKLQKPLSTSRSRLDDSNGNSATSSLSTSSSNSSLNATHIDKPNGNDVGFLTTQLNEIYSRGLIE